MTLVLPGKANSDAFEAMREALVHDRPLAFVGAGTSVRMGYPLWSKLMEEMAELTRDDLPPKDWSSVSREPDLLWRAQVYRDAMGQDRYASFIKKTFRSRGRPPDACLIDLVALPFSHVLTTNYDPVLEEAHAHAFPSQHAENVSWTDGELLREFICRVADRRYPRRYVYVHGRYDEPGETVLSDRDYEQRYVKSPDTAKKLFALLATQRVVFVGFSLSDPDLMAILREVKSDMGVGDARHFALLGLPDPDVQNPTRRRLRNKFGIEGVFYDARDGHEGMAEILSSLSASLRAAAPAAASFAVPGDVQPSPPLGARPGETVSVAEQVQRSRPPPVAAPARSEARPNSRTFRGDVGLGPPQAATRSFPALSTMLGDDPEESADDGALAAGGEREPAAPAAGAGPSAAPRPMPALVPAPAIVTDPDDPQKGHWGGLAERDGLRLSARVTAVAGGVFRVHLEVARVASAALTGTVRFHLHNTFQPPSIDVAADGGKAVLERVAYGAFTVGAEAGPGRTKLELDLALLEGAPAEFRDR